MPLVCPRGSVEAHRQACLTSLRDALPTVRGRYALRTSPDGLRTDLILQSVGQPEWAERHGGERVPVVPLLESVERRPRDFWLAWYEEWRAPQPRKGIKVQKAAVQFKASSVSVYAGLAGGAKRQVLRGEWAGAEVADSGAIVFQGQSAAHPHWHLAGLAAEDSVGAARTPEGPTPFDPFDGDAGVIDFDPSASAGSPPTSRSVDGDAMWASIHLAASARWAEREWVGAGSPSDMHAFTPTDCAEIKKWVLSCVRYLQSELQGQIVRARRF